MAPSTKPQETNISSLSRKNRPARPQSCTPGASPSFLLGKRPLEKQGGMLAAAATAAKSLQSCPTLCNPIDGSPPGSPVPGILQARTLEWVAISFSNAWKWKVKVKSLSRIWLIATPWTAAYQAPPSMGFSRQEYWSGVPLPSPKEKQGGMLAQTAKLGSNSGFATFELSDLEETTPLSFPLGINGNNDLYPSALTLSIYLLDIYLLSS